MTIINIFHIQGIEVLLEEGVYEAAYPLHDQLVHEEDAGSPEIWNDRMVIIKLTCLNKLFNSILFLEIISSLGEISKYISCSADSCYP